MMYLDDFIHDNMDLPENLKEMLTTIRKLDIAIQSIMDEQTLEADKFFENAKSMEPNRRDSVFETMMVEFHKILDAADEKVNIADDLHKLLVSRLEYLDKEIAEFKMNLEEVNPGVTFKIENRVSKNDDPVTNLQVVQENSVVKPNQKKKKMPKKMLVKQQKKLKSSSGLSSVKENLSPMEQHDHVFHVQKTINYKDNNSLLSCQSDGDAQRILAL